MQSNNQERGAAGRFDQTAYKLVVVMERVCTPEEAHALTGDAFSGVRAVIEEAAKFLLNQQGVSEFAHDISGYKLLMIAEMLDTVGRAADLRHDVWSGIRIILEEVTAALFDGDVVTA
jgi:hypothetical protein